MQNVKSDVNAIFWNKFKIAALKQINNAKTASTKPCWLNDSCVNGQIECAVKTQSAALEPVCRLLTVGHTSYRTVLVFLAHLEPIQKSVTVVFTRIDLTWPVAACCTTSSNTNSGVAWWKYNVYSIVLRICRCTQLAYSIILCEKHHCKVVFTAIMCTQVRFCVWHATLLTKPVT